MPAANLGATLETITRLGANAGLLLRALENRAALAAVELEEARLRAVATLLVAGVSTGVLFLAGATASLLVAAIFWDTPHRVLALALFGAFELLVAAGGGWWAWSRWQRWRPLEHTRDQFTKDAECLREIFKPGGNGN